MSLTDDLAILRQQSRAKTAEGICTVMDRAIGDLARSGVVDRGGSKPPTV